ncbi:Piso0_004748 [Millerozyma farinosa CBS 7064]|uniref:Piso0_004748 protein n=1 Tax=Pichia sorbitophila (strain ATCC MYA-4447 / BCRC 22081 / CBS 7064 / NBRC 10061 / NRRL Y-12695) TaxID=559304 RepID=G8Y3A2_PICSO|nr:Piso0_004748 [Millerozyma farinosa CBS 7064]
MIFAKPIYVEASCQELAAFLYGCRTELIQSRRLDFLSSSIGMIRNNLKKSLTEHNTEAVRKRIIYAKIALLQCDNVAKGGNLDFCVPIQSNLKNYVLDIDENNFPLEIDAISTQIKDKEKLCANIKTQGTSSDLVVKKLENLIFETIYKINEEIE